MAASVTAVNGAVTIVTALNRTVTVVTVGKQGPSGPMGGQGAVGLTNVQLVTTKKLPITNGQCTLPSIPLDGVVVFGIARVFYQEKGEWVMGEMDNINVVGKTLFFLDTIDLTGCFAVVSYLSLS